MVVVVADHGDHLGEKDRVNHAFGVYNSLVRVPLLVHDPTGASQPGKSVNSVVSTARLFHTLLTGASAASDQERALALTRADGVVAGAPQGVFSEGYPLEWAIQRLDGRRADTVRRDGYSHPVRAAYAGDYKLIVARQWEELFNIDVDPTEEHDLRDRLPEVRDALRLQLDKFVESHQPLARAQTQEEIDPQVRRQLRDLGYLE